MPTPSLVLLGLLLLGIAVAGEAMTIHFRGARLSGSFAALVLAMAFLGPLPAAAIAVASVAVDDALRRSNPRSRAVNAVTFAIFPLIGGALFAVSRPEDPISFAAQVVLVFFLTNTLNFAGIAAHLHFSGVLKASEAFGTVYRTMVPFE